MAQGGSLKKDDLIPELLEKIRNYNEEAKAHGQTLAERALSWILEQDGVTSVLVGASSVKQLAADLKAI